MSPDVALELIKLLLQVITADHVVSAPERSYIEAAARRLCGPRSDEALELLRAALDQGGRLPAPQMDVLRTHRAEVLIEVARAAAADGVQDEERELMREIAEMLR